MQDSNAPDIDTDSQAVPKELPVAIATQISSSEDLPSSSKPKPKPIPVGLSLFLSIALVMFTMLGFSLFIHLVQVVQQRVLSPYTIPNLAPGQPDGTEPDAGSPADSALPTKVESEEPQEAEPEEAEPEEARPAADTQSDNPEETGSVKENVERTEDNQSVDSVVPATNDTPNLEETPATPETSSESELNPGSEATPESTPESTPLPETVEQ